MSIEQKNTGPLKDIRVFDMSRILAGPSATQILGDLGAEIIKIEKPEHGDDTRQWGPPFVQDAENKDTSESGYYLSANRNKKSLTLDFTKPEGLALAKKLLSTCDILFENYKVGTLEKYGLGYEQIKSEFPHLIYCSMTGFGQTGPYKDRAGYDYLIQAMGGVMSLNGPIDDMPYKMPVAFADIMTGLYSLTGVLAALHHKTKTGEGQFIDISLLDTQVAVLSNAAQYYLTSKEVTPRMGNGHPTIVPYEVFKAKDHYIVLAVGNDRQFKSFCTFANKPALAEDINFKTNQMRVQNRKKLIPLICDILIKETADYWIKGLEKLSVPCGPVNTLDQVFNDPQVKAREMTVDMSHPLTPNPVTLVSSPLKFSKTPVSYRHAPPTLSEDTIDILKNELQLSEEDITLLKNEKVI